MKEIISLIIPSIFLFCYMILSSIEFGSSYFRLFPKILTKPESLKTYAGPIWETTTVFLVFFITSMFTFFPGANAIFGSNLLPVIFIALLFFGLRIIGMLFIFYGDIESKIVDIIFFIGSFGTPIILSLVFIYMMTGEWFGMIFTSLYLGLAGIILSTIILLSALFFDYFESVENNRRLWRVIRRSFYLLFIFILIFFYSISIYAPYMFASTKEVIIFAVLIIAAISFFMLALRASKALLSFIGGSAITAALFFPLLFFHLPYLIYPNVTIYNAFTDPASYNFLIISFIIGAIIILPSLFLLYHLFVFRKKDI